MVQIKILSGQKAGEIWVPRRFPVQLGRTADSDLRLEEPGVWDRHCRICLDPANGFFLEGSSDIVVRINSQPTTHSALRNGDTIELGSARIQFWLGPVRQRRSAPGEMLAWTLVCAVFLAQLGLIYWLLSAG